MLTTDAVMRMNVRVLVDRAAPRTVAGDWLRQADLAGRPAQEATP
jgi:glycine betaine/choline ABC-type transport system substrate-binding protein